jgi:eukaryotic-like serine/threonine-protein kinase
VRCIVLLTGQYAFYWPLGQSLRHFLYWQLPCAVRLQMGTLHAMAAVNISEGQVLAGKYRVERIIGEGGMGVVVAARHLQLDESVAIKFLLPDVAQNPEAVERFAREARASIKIKSEHVVRVMDVGTLEGNVPYMVMEFLQGGDLSALLQVRGGPLQVQEAVEYVLQACEALADAHVLGIVHRDLKPANLFLLQRSDGSPCVKVLDFGISKMTGTSASNMQMTKTTAVMGSPLYMSPEQMASSRDVDARSDIWALGAILYELLTAKPPFLADTLPQVCALILQSNPEPMRATRPDVPEAVERVVLKCLEKKREDRYQNVGEFAVALHDYATRNARTSIERIGRVLQASGLSISSMNMPPSSAIPAVGQTAGAWTQTASGKKSANKGIFLVMGALLLVGVGLGVVALKFLRGSSDSTATSSSGLASSVSAAPAPDSAPVASSNAPPVDTAAPPATTSVAAIPPPSKTAKTGPVTTTTAKTAPTTKTGATGTKKGGSGKGLDLFNDNK